MTNKRTRYKRSISVRGETAMALKMAHKTGWDEEYFGKSFNSLTHMMDHLINAELDKCGDKSMPKDSDLYYVNQQLKKELKEARQELEAIKAIRVSDLLSELFESVREKYPYSRELWPSKESHVFILHPHKMYDLGMERNEWIRSEWNIKDIAGQNVGYMFREIPIIESSNASRIYLMRQDELITNLEAGMKLW